MSASAPLVGATCDHHHASGHRSGPVSLSRAGVPWSYDLRPQRLLCRLAWPWEPPSPLGLSWWPRDLRPPSLDARRRVRPGSMPGCCPITGCARLRMLQSCPWPMRGRIVGERAAALSCDTVRL